MLRTFFGNCIYFLIFLTYLSRDKLESGKVSVVRVVLLYKVTTLGLMTMRMVRMVAMVRMVRMVTMTMRTIVKLIPTPSPAFFDESFFGTDVGCQLKCMYADALCRYVCICSNCMCVYVIVKIMMLPPVLYRRP